MVGLGDRADDRITGFQGVVVGRCEYITGCRQVCLQPPAIDGELKGSHWFDESRVEYVGPAYRPEQFLSESVEAGGPNRDCPAPR